jgi:glycosyltransferase involved in cell wall biosynthesis
VTLATSSHWLLFLLIWLLAFGWLWQWLQWLRNFPQIQDLHQLDLHQLPVSNPRFQRFGDGDLPRLTVVVPACNEATSIGTTLRTLLASQGVAVQIIAVNDRSTDETGKIMDAVAAENSSKDREASLEVIHIQTLAPGWLGKPHALDRAVQSATADWLLFTDGDVVFAPEAISLAMRYALAESADHVVLMPDWTMKSYGEAAMHGAMHALSTWTFRLWRVADPATRDFLGVGAFNLIRRSTYDAVGGFEALRMEVLEDLRLGWKVKRAGYRQRVVLGPGLAAVRWSEGAWGVVRNLEKNLFALYRYNVPLTLVACFGLAVQILLPLAALLFGDSPTRLGALVLYAAVAGIYVASRKVTRVKPWYVVAYPVAASLFLFAMLRSMTLALLRGGVVWRGTLYSLKELRKHAGPFWSA